MSEHSQSPSPPAAAAEAERGAADVRGLRGHRLGGSGTCVCMLDGERVRRETLPHTPEAIAAWVAGLEREFAGRSLAVMLEQSHGGQAQALMQFPQLVLFPIKPRGIAPITQRFGQSCHVHRRYACHKFLRQTFHKFADHARKWSCWSKAYYNYLRAHGHRHHAALRALAFKWIRILFRCWKDHKPYNEDPYIQQLKSKSESVPYLANVQST